MKEWAPGRALPTHASELGHPRHHDADGISAACYYFRRAQALRRRVAARWRRPAFASMTTRASSNARLCFLSGRPRSATDFLARADPLRAAVSIDLRLFFLIITIRAIL